MDTQDTEPTPAAPHPELTAEQAYLDHAYECLEEMRQQASRGLRIVVAGDPYAEEAIYQMFLSRLADLSEESALCFGRIDRVDGDRYYIGRRHVHEQNLDPVVIDWRAPMAEAFYQATWDDPWELERRRSFLTEGRLLLDIQDEEFAAHAVRSAEAAGPLVRAGDALLAELGRERTGRMRDVAATIQREQDRLIRAPADGILVVQGGPGTGKTAVGLHRAAYLLYSMRTSLGRTGVLIVGPNSAFMRYVERVLPNLGETTVVQKAIDELASVRVEREEPDEIARQKGEAAMANVLRAALVAETKPPRRPVQLRVGLRAVTVDPADVEAALASAHTSAAPYRERRDRFAVLMADRVLAKAGGAAAVGDEPRDVLRRLSADPAFRGLLDRVWPTVRPADLVHGVVGSKGWPVSDGGWSAADGALIDEAQALIAGTPRTYGHVIVDEAQDYSPMQLRMIARRAPSGSITVLGDVAQATGLWPHSTWDEVLAHLPGGGSERTRVEELTIGYRVPRQILQLAGRLLPMVGSGLRGPEAIRDGEEPSFVRVESGDVGRVLLREMEGAMSRRGTLGVIVPDGMLDDLLVRARVNGLEVDAADWGRGRKITVLTARHAKGLEFDHVVVVEPADIVAGGSDGYRRLYVALTRATQTLKVIHSGELPGPLSSVSAA
jgi:DNA helicase IV